MGLTASSTGRHAAATAFCLDRQPGEFVIALAGNPNVGKSTVFNALTGANQHTGNWPGKTVVTAQGTCTYHHRRYRFVDLPGTYSLSAHSAEEEVARDFLCSGAADAVVVVCDATCLERNLNLALQTMEITPQVLLCVNLLDEAKRKGLSPDLSLLEQRLGVPVAGTSANRSAGLDCLMERLEALVLQGNQKAPAAVAYPPELEAAMEHLSAGFPAADGKLTRFAAVQLLADAPVASVPLGGVHIVMEAKAMLEEAGLAGDALTDAIASGLVRTAEQACRGVVAAGPGEADRRDRRLDRLFTSRFTGIPIMLLLLAGILWLTIVGANYPSQWLSQGLSWVRAQCGALFLALGAPDWLRGVVIDGALHVLFWVVSVMLPPMAIFFPLFTLLEDFGYLPRVAFNLDHAFQRAKTCGKQCLSMCMGIGCNAAGVIGCRIIDSPRERLIAMLTNSFVPCNGRFPLLIAMISMFFLHAATGAGALYAACLLTGILVLGVLMTFLSSRLLSATVLKGMPSSFTLELPPYRIPRVGQVLVRSLLDRTLFVLGRAVVVALPAGVLIWLFANLHIGGQSLLAVCTGFLDPFARLLGLDGVILMAFILGFPANEIVLPIIIMAYLSTGTLLELDSLSALRTLLVDNGWTLHTAICTMLFSLMHWPCSTTCLTVYRETRSARWTLLSILLPTGMGMAVCFLFTACVRLLGLG